jgi:hypothetical protein
MLAVRSEHSAVVDLLCKHGCDMHAHGFDNIDPIDYAINKRNLYLFDVLMRHERQNLASSSISNDGSNSTLNTSTTIVTTPTSTNHNQNHLENNNNDNELKSSISLTSLIQEQQNIHNKLQIQSLNDSSVFQSD